LAVWRSFALREKALLRAVLIGVAFLVALFGGVRRATGSICANDEIACPVTESAPNVEGSTLGSDVPGRQHQVGLMPEPATWVLSISAVALMVIRRVKRQRLPLGRSASEAHPLMHDLRPAVAWSGPSR